MQTRRSLKSTSPSISLSYAATALSVVASHRSIDITSVLIGSGPLTGDAAAVSAAGAGAVLAAATSAGTARGGEESPYFLSRAESFLAETVAFFTVISLRIFPRCRRERRSRRPPVRQ